jgi:hypothetical protein
LGQSHQPGSSSNTLQKEGHINIYTLEGNGKDNIRTQQNVSHRHRVCDLVNG